jgi:hypothetical protein
MISGIKDLLIKAIRDSISSLSEKIKLIKKFKFLK